MFDRIYTKIYSTQNTPPKNFEENRGALPKT